MAMKLSCLPSLPVLGKRTVSALDLLFRNITTESNTKSLKPYEDIPGPKAWPVIRSSWTYWPLIGRYDIKHIIDANMRKYRQFGKIVREQFPGRPDVVLLFDPKDFAEMYRKEGKYPIKPRFQSVGAYRQTRKDLFPTIGFNSMHGKGWHDIRSKIQPHIMRPKAIKSHMPTVDRVATKFIGILPDLLDHNGEVKDFLQELYKWVVETATLVILDKQVECMGSNLVPGSDADNLIQSVQNIFNGISKLEMGSIQLWTYVSTPTWRRFVKANDVLTRFVFEQAEMGKQRLLKKGGDIEDPTFLESYLMEGLNPGDGLTDMMLASIDTTSHALAFALYHLAVHSDAQEKCYQEIRQIVPSADTPITQDMLQKLPFFKASVKESSRLLPVNGFIFRKLESEVVLSDYLIPAGVTIITQNQVAGLLEENFPDPLVFRPERWLNESENRVSPLIVLPFGIGPRMCIGKGLSDIELWILLAKILRKYKVEWMCAEELGYFVSVINVPDKPLHFRFTHRHH